ncbi:MAG: hypothetical protein KY468_16550, partial [Armatimonadetes bacterium]|nr:hypothetical protein [Armatimonadota bacterium]
MQNRPSDNVPSSTLEDFLQQTGEADRPGDVFELESDRMLEIHVNGRVWTKLGAAVAYRGDVRFNREGMMEGGVGKMLKRMVTNEMTPLAKALSDEDIENLAA